MSFLIFSSNFSKSNHSPKQRQRALH